MDGNNDVLVGLRFEVSGGLGRMGGHILGKAGGLYLVQKQGAEHFELLGLDDLRSAKFYPEAGAETAPAGAPAAVSGTMTPAVGEAVPARRRLTDQIRKHLSGGN